MTLRDFTAYQLPDLQDHDLATEYLGRCLKARDLALLLGAGVSRGAGLPDWAELVARCEQAVGLTVSPAEADLMRAFDGVRRELARVDTGKATTDLVREQLYDAGWLGAGEYPTELMRNRMLIAIGALVMSSSRGSVSDVFTLNFDDLLEWYLGLHGFTAQVVSDLPTYLKGDVDVTVFHLHGFIPLVPTAHPSSEWMILSHQELIGRLAANADAPWPMLLGSRFLTKRFLAVGTSMTDFDIEVYLARAREKGSQGPLGFVVDVEIPGNRQSELLEAGLVPVVLSDYDAVPDFLLGICRRAATF